MLGVACMLLVNLVCTAVLTKEVHDLVKKSCISENVQWNHLHTVGCFTYIYFSISLVLNLQKYLWRLFLTSIISLCWKWVTTKRTRIEFSLFCVRAWRTDKSLTLIQVCDNIAVIRHPFLTIEKNSWNIVWLSDFCYWIHFLSCKAFLINGESISSERWTKLNKNYINLVKGQNSLYFCEHYYLLSGDR